MKRLASDWDSLAALLIGLIAFAIRLKGMHGIDLGLDGGLSLALAGLPLSAALDFLAHDVHPPVYYLVLRLWIGSVGSAPFVAKFLGVGIGTLSVLALFGWARSLVGSRAALVACLLLAVSPVAVAVDLTVREYSLAILLTLLAAWATTDQSARSRARFVGVGVLAVWTSYLALPLPFVVALAALVRHDARRWWESVAIVAAVIPWLAFATAFGFLAVFQSSGPRQQTATVVEPLAQQLRDVLRMLDGGLLLHPTLLGPVLLVVSVALLAAASFLSPWERVRVRADSPQSTADLTQSDPPFPSPEGEGTGAGRLSQPVASLSSIPNPQPLTPALGQWLLLAILNIAVAIAVNTFWTREGLGVRYVAPALPFLFVGFGYAAQQTLKWAPALAALAVGLVVVPNVLGTVAWYGRPTLPPSFWDPAALVAALDARTAANDTIAFVSAEQAGYYQALSQHPRPWILIPAGTDYLQGNVVERAEATLPELSGRSRVIWLVLYRGVLGDGTTKLGDWLSLHDFAVATETVPDSELDPYLGQAAGRPSVISAQNIAFADHVRLVDARFPTAVPVSGVLPVELRWQAAGPLDRNLKVFIHLINQKGEVVSQHDSLPENGRAPFTRWQANQVIDDRHGLLLSSAVVPGEYWLEIGLYDEHGRLPLQAGGDTLRLGPIRVTGTGIGG